MASSSPDHLLAGLTADQRAAVTCEAGVLCVVAGAGSGKTTVLTRRVAWRVLSGSADPAHVQVVTFTRKAAIELRSRLGRLGAGPDVRAATFHAAAYAQLRRHWADQVVSGPALLPDGEGMVRRLTDSEPGFSQEQAATVWSEVRWARARLVEPDDYPEAARRARRSPGMALDQLAWMMQRYRDEKRRRRVIDLDDLVPLCTELLEAGGPPADALRWRVRHLFVDEFQDVNPAQWRLVEAWRGGRPDLCVVGDPRQSIYAWNGSDPTLMARLPTLVPETVVLSLEENHRSTPQIVMAATAVLSPAATTLSDSVGGGRVVGGGVGASRDPGPPPLVRGFEYEDAEATAVARWIRTNGRPGDPWSRQAVLARTHARLSPVAHALERSGVPVNRPGRSGRPGALAHVLRSLRSVDRRMPLQAGLIDALSGTESAGLRQTETDRHAADEVLAPLVAEHAGEEPEATVGSFLTWLAANQDGGVVGLGGDGVQLLTFHQAKGLEWPAVAVIGLEQGTMPIAYATDGDALSEERRLLYVALTRAEDRLWCSWSARPTADSGSSATRGPSPYLGAVGAVVGGADRQDPIVPGRRLAELRHRLAAAG